MSKTKDDLQAELDKLKQELSEANALNENLTSQAAEKGNISIPVKGTFTAELLDEDGKLKKKKFGFRDGARATRLADGTLVPTEELMNIAKNKNHKFSPKLLELNPHLATLTHEIAAERLQELAAMGYGLLVEK